MTVEEMLRAGEVKTAENGLVHGVLAGAVSEGAERPPLERMVNAVPRSLVPRLGRSMIYFVPWLCKQRRGVAVSAGPLEAAEGRKELCHHLDVKPSGNLLLVSLHFYENDNYGLAMEFFDKVAYLATLERDAREDFYDLLRRQWGQEKAGELTPETWEWRTAVPAESPKTPGGDSAGEAWSHYERAAEADALGLYMASVFTDVFYEDLFDSEEGFPAPTPETVYERVRTAERLYPANRGYSLQVVRQKPRRRGGR